MKNLYKKMFGKERKEKLTILGRKSPFQELYDFYDERERGYRKIISSFAVLGVLGIAFFSMPLYMDFEKSQDEIDLVYQVKQDSIKNVYENGLERGEK